MIQLKNISHAFGKKPVLTDVSCNIATGKLTAIMGLNGSGKTTLLNIMSGLIPPDYGQVILDKTPLKKFSARERAKNLAHVPQDFHTEFPFTVKEFVQMGRFAWQDEANSPQMDSMILNATLARLDLTSLAARSVHTLSGGERQKVLLARTLVQNTPLILLDEPLNHLDIKNRLFLLNLLRDENRQHGKTIVAVLHDLQAVKNHFDEAVLLKNGQVIFAGPVQNGLTPEHIFTTFEVDVAT